jgi:hypothetical protein
VNALKPAHPSSSQGRFTKMMDCRVKPGNDDLNQRRFCGDDARE